MGEKLKWRFSKKHFLEAYVNVLDAIFPEGQKEKHEKVKQKKHWSQFVYKKCFNAPFAFEEMCFYIFIVFTVMMEV